MTACWTMTHVANDATVQILVKQALNQARAGCDVIAPSDMMDGRIGAIRSALDAEGYEHVMIMAYAAKYASGFYGPFRDAVGSATQLKGASKATCKWIPPIAMRPCVRSRWTSPRARIWSHKPGMPYLDIVSRVSRELSMPTFAYQVSGEYAMIMAAAQNGWLEKDRTMMESLLAFKRAGAHGILTYFAVEAAEKLSAV